MFLTEKVDFWNRPVYVLLNILQYILTNHKTKRYPTNTKKQHRYKHKRKFCQKLFNLAILSWLLDIIVAPVFDSNIHLPLFVLSICYLTLLHSK